ncbi:hypothetical protein BGV72_25760 [Burkholderia ubonensis]|nr:hypothetical protein BGV72_25760 [Burkholderia ubonensis]
MPSCPWAGNVEHNATLALFACEADAGVAKTNRKGEIVQSFAEPIIVFNTRKCESKASQPWTLLRIFRRSRRHTYLVETLVNDFEVNKRSSGIHLTHTIANPSIEFIKQIIVKIPPWLPGTSHEVNTPSCVFLQELDVAPSVNKEVLLMPHT